MHLYVGIQYISYHLVMSTLYNLATLGSPVYVHDSPVDTPSSCTEHWAQMAILVLCLISINQAITTSDSLTTYPIILATRKSSHKLQLQCQSVLKVWCWVKKVSQMCLVRHCMTFWYLYEPGWVCITEEAHDIALQYVYGEVVIHLTCIIKCSVIKCNAV